MRIEALALPAVLLALTCRPAPAPSRQKRNASAADLPRPSARPTSARIATASVATAPSSCCELGLTAHPCDGGNRVRGAPDVAGATRTALEVLAQRASAAIDAKDYAALASLVHPRRGLVVQHRMTLSRRDVKRVATLEGRHDFSWDGECPLDKPPHGDVVCPTEPLTMAEFFDHLTTRQGPRGPLTTPLGTTSEIAVGHIPVDDVCNLCFFEGELARSYPGRPFVVYQRRLPFVDGCYWEGNQAVVFLFERGDDDGRFWLSGLLRGYGGA